MTEEIATFQDFGFKLAVVDKLMYKDSLLSPRFDLAQHTGRQFQGMKDEDYSIVPEARKYFEELAIPTRLLTTIDELYQDGGDEVYLQLCPQWSGEDDIFNIRSAADVQWLPNLKTVTLFYDDDPTILADFEARGISASWL